MDTLRDLTLVRDAYLISLDSLKSVESNVLSLPMGHKAQLLSQYAQTLAFVSGLDAEIKRLKEAH